MAAADDLVEMRFNVPRATFDVFDGVSKAKRVPKNALAASIIGEWADVQVHIATVVLRMAKGNGNDSQSDWGALPE